MIIRNGLVFDANCKFKKLNIQINGDVIAEVSEHDMNVGTNAGVNAGADARNDAGNDSEIDATGMYVIPGLTDIHFHGCAGHDFCEGNFDAIHKIAGAQLEKGVTTICPATMSFSEEKLIQICNAAKKYADDCAERAQESEESSESAGAELIGIHLEGPFLSWEKRGAQNAQYLRTPDADMFFRLQEAAGGLIKIVDIAPELDGAPEFIKQVKDSVHVSLAHTTADYDTAMNAFLMGADHVTHLYNAMPPIHHRNPGVIGAVSDFENAYVELIGDNIHCAPAMVRLAIKMMGRDRLVLISDSMSACGMPDGTYELGGQKVLVKGREAKLLDGTIAGSVTNLMDCMRLLIQKVGISSEDAVRFAAVNPVKAIGVFDTFGSIERGKRANLVVLNKDFEIEYVIQNGRCIDRSKKN